MQIRAGYQITYECPQRMPMVLMLSVHPTRAGDLVGPAPLTLDPPLPARHCRDIYAATTLTSAAASLLPLRIGRILMVRGRDARDVALSTTFGQTRLVQFSVMAKEVVGVDAAREEIRSAGA
jgi:hypothetical protein